MLFRSGRSATDCLAFCCPSLDAGAVWLLCGYFFVSAYERGLSFPDFHDVRVQINCGEKQFSLPPVDIKAGSLFFYPFHLSVAGVDFDYVLAQPIAKVAQGEQTICYFIEIPGIAPILSASGEVTQLPVDTVGFEKGNVQVIVLSKAKAMRFHLIGNHVVFAKGSVYTDGDRKSTRLNSSHAT